MTPLTISLYVTSGLVIGILAAFSAHNRKTGWRKPQVAFADALEDLYADLGLSSEAPETAPVHQFITRRQPVETHALDAGDFTLQLLNLRNALSAESAIETTVVPEVEEKELVAVKARRA